jgi:hypothetical protein
MRKGWFALVLVASLVGMASVAEAATPQAKASAAAKPNPVRHPIQAMEHKQKTKHEKEKAAHKGGGGGGTKHVGKKHVGKKHVGPKHKGGGGGGHAVGPKPNPVKHPGQAVQHEKAKREHKR